MRLIDVDALMERLGIAYDCRECDQDKSPYCTWKPDAIDVCQIISDAPVIEEREKGQWITDKYGSVWCSKCNWCAPQVMTGCLVNRHLEYEKSAFCWNCGADMRGTPNDQS